MKISRDGFGLMMLRWHGGWYGVGQPAGGLKKNGGISILKFHFLAGIPGKIKIGMQKSYLSGVK